ncbi:D-alanyl-D-alanine carboxypeptidase family protein [Culicoidibacter larvae]|uniref:D-alanyl-D-alanine carboxypeptidase n=1 Tax=Culicoidibacter larvae TaxID=2579976 RepID=A0A5R8QCC8_9FIRM|nr:serine hydrolase [Culicoidibacter larvae]TLG74158.1 D-alanyl-D-alanine carboxypeptidase [Culicoidibacter larvae]
MQRRDRRRVKRRLKGPVKWGIAIVVTAVAIASGYSWVVLSKTVSLEAPQVVSEVKSSKPLPNVYSQAFVLLDARNNSVVAQKGGEDKIYPASLVKMMTVILAIEESRDLQERVTLSADIFSYLFTNDASVAGFSSGEVVPVIDLLYGAILPSGGDAALGLAEHVSGSETAFVGLMNRKAEALGMKYTHFTNASGLHDANQYSTVSDLVILMQYALQNNTFKQVISTPEYTTYEADAHEEGLSFSSTFFNMADNRLAKGKFIGGKTGTTDEAGLNLASAVEVNGTTYILVSAGAKDDGNKNQYEDAITIYNAYL